MRTVVWKLRVVLNKQDVYRGGVFMLEIQRMDKQTYTYRTKQILAYIYSAWGKYCIYTLFTNSWKKIISFWCTINQGYFMNSAQSQYSETYLDLYEGYFI